MSSITHLPARECRTTLAHLAPLRRVSALQRSQRPTAQRDCGRTLIVGPRRHHGYGVESEKLARSELNRSRRTGATELLRRHRADVNAVTLALLERRRRSHQAGRHGPRGRTRAPYSACRRPAHSRRLAAARRRRRRRGLRGHTRALQVRVEARSACGCPEHGVAVERGRRARTLRWPVEVDRPSRRVSLSKDQ